MATTLTLATGGLTATLSTADDTAAQLVLVRFAHACGAPADMPAQQKLTFAANALTDYMIRVARDRYIQEESAAIAAAALTQVHW
jgi:ferredoxin-NADP reductase